MLLIACHIATALGVYLLRKQIQRLPVMFYLLALLATAIGLSFIATPVTHEAIRLFSAVIQKGHIAFTLFALVMFIGALDKNSRLRKEMLPIRSELSIIASIMICGHFAGYLRNLIVLGLKVSSLKLSVLLSLAVSLLLLLLLSVLVFTSIKVVRRRITAKSWKRIQILAYPFFGLILLHLLGYLIVPATAGKLEPCINIFVYLMIFGTYLFLRLKQWEKCRRN